MIEGRHGLLSLLDEVSSYKDNDGAVLVNRYNRVMSNHQHYFPGEEAVYGTAYGRERKHITSTCPRVLPFVFSPPLKRQRSTLQPMNKWQWQGS